MTAMSGGKERMARRRPHAIDWKGNRLDAGVEGKSRASRIAVSPCRCGTIRCSIPTWRKGEGVPISAIIFGGRRSDTMPLVFQAFDWTHGVYVGATMASETTAAATGAVGQVRRDPMAMLPFCGYNMGDYFQHWLEIGPRLTNPPLIFHVNWFRKGADGKFLWPGFGDNMRVLKWIIDRCEGHGGGAETEIGTIPRPEDFRSRRARRYARNDARTLLDQARTNGRKSSRARRSFSKHSSPICPRRSSPNARR